MTILRLCDRFHCLPDQLLEHDARLWQYLKIEGMVNGNGGG